MVAGRIVAAQQPLRAISSSESGSPVHEFSEEQDNSHIFGQRDKYNALPQQGGGGARSAPLNRLALDILKFCQDHGIFPIPSYLPGVANLSADTLSSCQESNEWFLNTQSPGGSLRIT